MEKKAEAAALPCATPLTSSPPSPLHHPAPPSQAERMEKKAEAAEERAQRALAEKAKAEEKAQALAGARSSDWQRWMGE